MRIRSWLFTMLLLSSTGSFADEMKIQTFETVKTPTKYATGFKLEKGWVKKATVRDVKVQAALPRHFDWREQGKLTPVFDQGNCGSCWAQATATTFQDVMSLRGLGQIALSRQYLLSCNKEGWSCNGGFFAHDYHMGLPMGAVPDVEFPYVARQVACKTGLSHLYHITSWAYLPSKNENTPPTVEAIKNAIYTYGPVAVGVGANDAFMNYSSGVFNGCDGTPPNHAVVLVGWNDDGQYWILKNSWGPSWGIEQGHMNIRYSCNYVGVAANYIVFNSPNPNPNPNPNPSPTPTPPPVPKCTPVPYANAGADVRTRRGQPTRLGTPARSGTTYHWESSAGKGRPLDTALIVVRPTVSQIFTVYATTKCGTAQDSAIVIVRR